MNRRRSFWGQIQNSLFYGLGLVVFAVFLYVTIWGKEGLLVLRTLHQKKALILATNHKLLEENLLFLKEIQKLKKVRFVEQRARTDLGLIRDNEMVYVMPDRDESQN